MLKARLELMKENLELEVRGLKEMIEEGGRSDYARGYTEGLLDSAKAKLQELEAIMELEAETLERV